MRGETEQILLSVFENINFPLLGKGKEVEISAGLTIASISLACPNRTGSFATNDKNVTVIQAQVVPQSENKKTCPPCPSASCAQDSGLRLVALIRSCSVRSAGP